ncbi:5-hydroxytryptamine receptor 3A-like [Dunckerocampus dactyliophorus]|uniref:5-hydroxytryptamine receptor 3A-like n=1 Tax=Dunckerocampus dactyliophorus TaxID=161453 RepID=UPI0024065D5E|nr:5-hydroxytryptamine receptor 3A-like [Dunckerocampus dactyliophorus]
MTMTVLFTLLVLSAVGGAARDQVCSYQDVVDHLNLTTNTKAFQLTRPVLDHTRPTLVELNIILYAILDVIEKTQTFIPFIWASMIWHNERIFWDPAQFCGITEFSIPNDMLWKPDIFIQEMTEKDNSHPSPYLLIHHDGKVIFEQDMRVVSTCKMDVHKFPFDTQRCNMSLGSGALCYDQLRVIPVVNSSRATEFSKELLQSQGEWEFLHLSVTSYNLSFDGRVWEQLVFTFVIKRRPLLHVINFLLPILFFLCLDLASYFIPVHSGEKLSFKVTVLLAISVLLLILNDILPSMSNKTPLIATYCIVIFALMLLSLLETILVIYLTEGVAMEKLACCADKAEKATVDKSNTTKERRQAGSLCTCVSSGEKQHEMLPVVEEVNNGVLSSESQVLLLVMAELTELQRMLSVHLNCREDGGKAMRLASKINKAFFFFYLLTASLFLLFLYLEWTS